MRYRATPRPLPELARERASVMAARAALEAVKQHDERGIRRTCQTIDIDEIAVRRVPALSLPINSRTAEQRAVQCLQVCAGQPPGSSVGAWRQCRIFGDSAGARGACGAGDPWCRIIR